MISNRCFYCTFCLKIHSALRIWIFSLFRGPVNTWSVFLYPVFLYPYKREDPVITSGHRTSSLHTKFKLSLEIHNSLRHQILMHVCATIKVLGGRQEEVEKEISVWLINYEYFISPKMLCICKRGSSYLLVWGNTAYTTWNDLWLNFPHFAQRKLQIIN